MGQDRWQHRFERKIERLRSRGKESDRHPLETEFDQAICGVIEPTFQEFKQYCEQKGIKVRIRIGHDPPYAHFAITGAEFFPHYSVSRALHFTILSRSAREENKVEVFEEFWRQPPTKEEETPLAEYGDLVTPEQITKEFVQARLTRLLERYLDAELNY